jgi:hypothetical protein
LRSRRLKRRILRGSRCSLSLPLSFLSLCSFCSLLSLLSFSLTPTLPPSLSLLSPVSSPLGARRSSFQLGPCSTCSWTSRIELLVATRSSPDKMSSNLSAVARDARDMPARMSNYRCILQSCPAGRMPQLRASAKCVFCVLKFRSIWWNPCSPGVYTAGQVHDRYRCYRLRVLDQISTLVPDRESLY